MGHPGSRMAVATTWHFQFPASSLWPLLCNSKMVQGGSPIFKLGIPLPLECRLPEGEGGAGSERECVSDKGTIHQRIVTWEPEKKLSFKMEKADFEILSGVTGIEDTFDLIPSDHEVTVTRTTVVELSGSILFMKKIRLFFGLRQVHRFVFQNWQSLAGS